MAMFDQEEEDAARRRREEAANPGATTAAPAESPTASDPYADYNNGSPVDAPLNAGHGWEWGGDRWNQVQGRGLGYNAPAASAGGGGAAAPAPQFQSPGAPQAQQWAPTPAATMKTPAITSQVTDLLKQRLGELSGPFDIQSDPTYQGQVRAAQVASLRGADRQRAALAERMAANGQLAGGTGGGFDAGVNGILEQQRESDRGYAAGLAGDRLNAREQQLMQAISMARSVGQDDVANQLELQRLQLQQELGRSDLDLRAELGRGQLGLGQAQLGQQGDLGYANLGLGYAGLQNSMNRDAILALLGGG